MIPGERNSGVICLNGAAARLVQPGDQVIIISYSWMEEAKAMTYQPKILFMDKNNRIKEKVGGEVHGTVVIP